MKAKATRKGVASESAKSARKGNGKAPKSHAERRPGDPAIGTTVRVTGGFSKGKTGTIVKYGLFKGVWYHARVQIGDEVRSVSPKNLEPATANKKPAASTKAKTATAQAAATTPQS